MNIIPFINYFTYLILRHTVTKDYAVSQKKRDTKLLAITSPVGHGIFLYGHCKQLFVSELNNAYFSRHLF